MKLLALDTCTENCSVAVYRHGEVFLAHEIAGQKHSERILNMIDSVLGQAGLTLSEMDALVFGRGPGSFTGVRIGVAVAQGIAFARTLPVIPISTLAATAQQTYLHTNVKNISVALDARMGEVYHADFVVENEVVIPLSEERVCPPEQVTLADTRIWTAAGNGWSIYPAQLQQRLQHQLAEIRDSAFPDAASMLPLAVSQYQSGNMLSADQALPVYLRNNVARKKAPQT
ncbi:Inactive metal-dependent proteases-like protein [Methylophaga frappieri]|uniref:tRNA threonylcarbamoyladenosine biosynthesis protein TsaB n=1 Tax=Methylophaga frappieri (strain ATCC BAA-2434 / DSM 25690 / JAM7) TaxID=754477 RepID=I1YEP2_METFJ|nr:tRNA (adenosine(37)-N6)-threonylcarbamoyltransferase complex dimerization subunit type 1 TsaB [Methylophaga frappieri]AFJ01385.1 Inactive metal-dependent proteases-like protein [Methylophaga frappieri]